MKKSMIHAGGDEIAKKVHEQLMGLSAQVSGAVADAVALSMIAGAAAAYRELSPAAPHEQAQLLQKAVGAEARSRH